MGGFTGLIQIYADKTRQGGNDGAEATGGAAFVREPNAAAKAGKADQAGEDGTRDLFKGLGVDDFALHGATMGGFLDEVVEDLFGGTGVDLVETLQEVRRRNGAGVGGELDGVKLRKEACGGDLWVGRRSRRHSRRGDLDRSF